MGADTKTTTARDFGYEPWARSAIQRGDGLTREQGAELIKSLDEARARVAELEQVEQRANDCLTAAGPGELDQAAALALRYVLTGDAHAEVSR